MTAVEAEEWPAALRIGFKTEGALQDLDANSLAGVRMDFRSGGAQGYSTSVLFHGALFHAGRGAEAAWGTKRQADKDVSVELADFLFKPADYAPKDWDGRAILTFLLQNTGAGTRAQAGVASGEGVGILPGAGNPGSPAGMAWTVRQERNALWIRSAASGGGTEVALFSQAGRVVARGRMHGGEPLRLATAALPMGLYLLRMANAAAAEARPIAILDR